jgi:hypothetical protein
MGMNMDLILSNCLRFHFIQLWPLNGVCRKWKGDEQLLDGTQLQTTVWTHPKAKYLEVGQCRNRITLSNVITINNVGNISYLLKLGTKLQRLRVSMCLCVVGWEGDFLLYSFTATTRSSSAVLRLPSIQNNWDISYKLKDQIKTTRGVQGRPWGGAGCAAAPGPQNMEGPISSIHVNYVSQLRIKITRLWALTIDI